MRVKQKSTIRLRNHYRNSTSTLLYGAGDEARTRDPLLGKQMLYH